MHLRRVLAKFVIKIKPRSLWPGQPLDPVLIIRQINQEKVRERDMTAANFKQIDDALANQLLAFVRTNNIGKSITVDGKSYTLDHISQSSSQFFQSRSISIYFRTGRSVIRISDHWSKSNHHPKSRKFNCGSLGGHFCQWVIDDKTPTTIDCTYRCGKFAHKMLAGICGLTVLNKTAPHWNKGEVKSA